VSNTLLTPDMITDEALVILHNNLAFARNVNRQYDSSFAQTGAKIGDTLRIRLPNRYTVTTGAAMLAQDTIETKVSLTVSTQKHVAMNFTSKELTLSIQDFSERIIQPAMAVLASAVDQDGLALYSNIYNSVGTPGTTPATSLVMLQANQKMNEFATPMDRRNLIVNPAANASLVDGMKGLFNAATPISEQFKRGKLASNVLGYDTIDMDQNVAIHTTGSRSTSDPILVNDTVVSGDSTISLDGGTGSATIKVGDVFTIANVYAVNPENYTSTGQLQQFVCTATNTASGGAWTDVAVSPSFITSGPFQTINALPANDAAVTFMGAASTAYPQNMAYHRDAFTLATADLELPPGNGIFASRRVMDGISMRIWRQGDIFNDQVPCRVDILYGWATLRPTMAARMWG